MGASNGRQAGTQAMPGAATGGGLASVASVAAGRGRAGRRRSLAATTGAALRKHRTGGTGASSSTSGAMAGLASAAAAAGAGGTGATTGPGRGKRRQGSREAGADSRLSHKLAHVAGKAGKGVAAVTRSAAAIRRAKRGDDVFGKDDYAWWTLDDVKMALVRARGFLSKDDTNFATVMLTRRQFWEVFTEYTRIRDGTFLALPMKHFDAFKNEDADTVPVLQLFLVLALFCQGETAEQLRFCFHLFDIDGGGTMDLMEMIQFITTLCRAAHRIKLISAVPVAAEVINMANEMMRLADVDGNGDISVVEFISWARTHVLSRRLLTAFREVRDDEARKAGATKVVNSPGKQQKSAEDMLRARIARANLSMLASTDLLGELATESGFSLRELRNLRRKFLSQAGATGAISKPAFCNLMRAEYPVLRTSSSVERLFDAFDEDGSKSIDFKEFTLGLSRLTTGSAEDRLSLVFEVYDQDGDGRVDVDELLKFVHNESLETSSVIAFTDQMLAQMDLDGDGTISRQEFVTSLQAQPLLYHTFTKSLQKPIANRGEARRILKKAKGFNLPALKALWLQYSAAGSMNDKLDLNGFLRLMRNEFRMPHSAANAVGLVFANLDADDSGRVAVKVLFNGLAQLADGTDEDRAELFFSLFQAGKELGSLDIAEVKSALTQSAETTEADAAAVNAILGLVDTDNDGEITLEEFKKAAAEDASVIGSFARLFGIDDTGPEETTEKKPESIADVIKATLARAQGQGGASSGGDTVIMKNAMSKFRRMSLGAMAETIENLQSEVPEDNKVHYRGSAASFAAKEHGKVLTEHLQRCRYDVRNDVYESAHARIVMANIRSASEKWQKALTGVSKVKPGGLPEEIKRVRKVDAGDVAVGALLDLGRRNIKTYKSVHNLKKLNEANPSFRKPGKKLHAMSRWDLKHAESSPSLLPEFVKEDMAPSLRQREHKPIRPPALIAHLGDDVRDRASVAHRRPPLARMHREEVHLVSDVPNDDILGGDIFQGQFGSGFLPQLGSPSKDVHTERHKLSSKKKTKHTESMPAIRAAQPRDLPQVSSSQTMSRAASFAFDSSEAKKPIRTKSARYVVVARGGPKHRHTKGRDKAGRHGRLEPFKEQLSEDQVAASRRRRDRDERRRVRARNATHSFAEQLRS